MAPMAGCAIEIMKFESILWSYSSQYNGHYERMKFRINKVDSSKEEVILIKRKNDECYKQHR